MKRGDIEHAASTSRITPLDWLVAVAVLIIQQAAFVMIPSILDGTALNASTLGSTPNPANTILVTANGIAVAALCLVHRRQAFAVVRGNWSSVLLALLVVGSTIWSIHPEITFRRGGGYVISIVTAVYLSSRFTTDQFMKVLSFSLAVTAIGSIAFVAAFPQYGIMQEAEPYYGTWRGVFTTKNPFGFAMAVGLFAECFILTGASTRRLRHMAMAAGFFVLVLQSQSVTAVVPSIIFLAGTCGYWLWTRAPRVAAVASIATVLLSLMAVVAVWLDPAGSLAIVGKNTTLSGRMGLWTFVIELIRQKPWLGWGYGALWLAGDDATVVITNAIGWKTASAQNQLLQTASQLGLVGVAVALFVIALALWRGLVCLANGRHRLGVFTLLFVIAMVIASITEEMLMGNQTISWVVFNVLSFNAGLEITRLGRRNERPAGHADQALLARAKPVDVDNGLPGLR